MIGTMEPFVRSLFPQQLSPALSRVVEILPASPFEATFDYATSGPRAIRRVLVEGEWVNLGSRIYNAEPDAAMLGTEGELVQAIVACVYSRSHDGYVREKYLRRLLALPYPWVAPFVFQLVGEYVMALAQLIADRSAALLANEGYRRFVWDNPEFLALTWARAVSYEDCYYRYYRRLYTPEENYPAFRFLSECCQVSPSCQGRRPTCRSYCDQWRARRASGARKPAATSHYWER